MIGRSGTRRPLAHRVGDAGRERAAARRRAPEARAAGDAPTLDRKLRARRQQPSGSSAFRRHASTIWGPSTSTKRKTWPASTRKPNPVPGDAIRRDRREAAAAGVKPVVEHRVERVPGPRQRRRRPSAHGPPGDAASGGGQPSGSSAVCDGDGDGPDSALSRSAAEREPST